MSAVATDTMQAFVMRRIGEAGVEEKPIPEPGPNDAVIRTTAALVCTSDVHTVKGAIPVAPNVTLGHEAVGVVHALGSAVEGLTEGQRVAVGALTPCGRLRQLPARPLVAMRRHARRLQVHRAARWESRQYFLVNDAGFQSRAHPGLVAGREGRLHVRHDEHGLRRVPRRARSRSAARSPCSRRDRSGFVPPPGARLLGAAMVIAVESKPDRQALARRFGADVIVDPSKGDPVQAILAEDGRHRRRRRDRGARPSDDVHELCEGDARPARGGVVANVGYHGELRTIRFRSRSSSSGSAWRTRRFTGFSVPGRSRAHDAHLPPHAHGKGRPDADDDARVRL